MRILLVQPPLTPAGPVEPPIGLAALGAWLLARGHSPRILDLELFQRLQRVQDWTACEQEFERTIADFGPQVVGVTSMYSNSLHAARLISRAKAANKNIVTLAGGSHFGALPRQSLARHAELDFVIQGEGESATSQLLDELEGNGEWSAVPSLAWRRGDDIAINPPSKLIDLAELPDPWTTVDQGLLDLTAYLATTGARPGRRVAYLEAGRGCPFECSFCATAPFWHRRYRVKSVERIIGEMRRLHRAGYERIVLVHDLLTVNRRFVRELCEALLDSKLPVEWMANSRTDISLDGILPLLKASGCWKLFFGVESASSRVQEQINKRLDPNAAFSTVANLSSHGLTATCSFVIGFPDETADEIGLSIRAGARLKLLGAETVQFHRLRIWPPAPLSEAGLPRSFDRTALEIEFPYVDVPPQDMAEIAGSPDFFGGYFSTWTAAGDAAQIAQVEMFAHHTVALAPMTIYALLALRPRQFLPAFYTAIARLGPLVRAGLDWDAGRLMRNWRAIAPYLNAIAESVGLSDTEFRLVAALFDYEDERVRFTAVDETQGDKDSPRQFVSAIDIPEAIRRIQREDALGEDLLRPTAILFRKNADDGFSSFAGPLPRPN